MAAPPRTVWLLVLAVVLVPILPWIAVGAWLEPWATGLVATTMARPVVALVGVGLLAVDSFLPIPATIVMSALGFGLGVGLGGAAAAAGLFLSGTIAYLVCRRWGTGMARRIAGERGLARVAQSMERHGPLVIAATRSVPVVQEATACLAGAVGMPARLYFTALAVGCVPTGFAYAAIGASALASHWWAVALSLAVPLGTWPFVWLALRAGREKKSLAG